MKHLGEIKVKALEKRIDQLESEIETLKKTNEIEKEQSKSAPMVNKGDFLREVETKGLERRIA